LRQAGRDDLADALEAGPAPGEEPQPSEPPAPAQPHELLAKQLDAAQSKWHTLGGGPDDGPAAA
jgi:hypothetical protein